MKKLSLIVIVAGSVLLTGCGSKPAEEPGYTKKDFEKTAPPPGFINNAPKGPGSSPPPATTGN